MNTVSIRTPAFSPIHGKVVSLPPKVLETLLVLIERHDRIVSKEEIFREVWPDTAVEESNLTQNIFVLRKTLKQRAEKRFIMTFPGRGYRFVAPLEEIPPEAAEQHVNRHVLSIRKLVAKHWKTATLLVSIAGAAALVLYFDSRRPGDSEQFQTTFFTSYPGSEVQPAWAPDGLRVAFSWNSEKQDHYRIFIKPLASEGPVRLTDGANDDGSPAWSPDGRQIAFVRFAGAASGVYVVPSNGGPARRIAELFPGRRAIRGRHLDWSPDGRFLVVNDKASPDDSLALYLISVSDGRKTRLTSPPARNPSDIAPRFSPDGSQLAFIRSSSYRVRDVFVLSLNNHEIRQLTDEGKWIGDLDWTNDGRELIFSSDRLGFAKLWRIRVSNRKISPIFSVGENASYIAVDRAGHHLIYSQTISDLNIWRLTLPSAHDPNPAWKILFASTRNEYGAQYSPDGRRIAFCSDRTGSRQLWIGDADGNNAHSLNVSPAGVASFDWSPDGTQFVYYARAGKDHDIYVVSQRGGPATRLTGEGAEDVLPMWSTDGRFIYYSSNRSGEWEIWRIRPDGSQSERITRNGGYAARPSPDGKYLYYAKGLTLPGIWRTPVDGGEEIRVTDFPKAEFWAAWTVTHRGVYWMEGPAPGVPPPPVIRQYDFRTGKITAIASPEKYSLFYNEYNLHLSPDGKQLLLSYAESSGSDLMMVNGFREHHLRRSQFFSISD